MELRGRALKAEPISASTMWSMRKHNGDAEAIGQMVIVGSITWADDGSPVWASVEAYQAERMPPWLQNKIIMAAQAANPMEESADPEG